MVAACCAALIPAIVAGVFGNHASALGGPRTLSGTSTTVTSPGGASVDAGTGRQAPLATDTFGVDGALLYGTPLTQNRAAHFAAIAKAGVPVLRRGLVWDEVEKFLPNPATGTHYFDWSPYDDFLSALAPSGRRWQPILGFTAAWASSVPGSILAPPRNPGDFAAFAANAAARYGVHGTFWAEHPDLPYMPVTTYEIWNEENTSGYWGNLAPDPARYADLYLAARTAIRVVDPTATVIVGGIARMIGWVPGAYPDGAYVAAMVNARPKLLGQIDGIGFHPYSRGGTRAVSDVLEGVQSLRATLRQLNLGNVPLYLTEVGWSTGGLEVTQKNVTEDERTKAIAITADELVRSDCGVRQYIAFTWVSDEGRPDGLPLNDQLRWFGIANQDATLKPTGQAFVSVIRSLQSDDPARVRKPVSLCSP